jgi:hypothetical protein
MDITTVHNKPWLERNSIRIPKIIRWIGMPRNTNTNNVAINNNPFSQTYQLMPFRSMIGGLNPTNCHWSVCSYCGVSRPLRSSFWIDQPLDLDFYHTTMIIVIPKALRVESSMYISYHIISCRLQSTSLGRYFFK